MAGDRETYLTEVEAPDAVPIHVVTEAGRDAWLAALSPAHRAWAEAGRFRGKPGEILRFPDADGAVVAVALGVGEGADRDMREFGALSRALKPGIYRIASDLPPGRIEKAAFSWALGGYRFTRYKAASEDEAATLSVPGLKDLPELLAAVRATFTVRDLVNIPAADMGPAELAAAVEAEAARHGAHMRVVEGEALLAENFPMVHAVGRAHDRAPRLIDLSWGAGNAPKLTLVGKGVTFDTGGLDLKPAAAMALMKKDMGGAAHALALAGMVMERKLPVRLRLVIPAVENSVSANAFRPGDILKSRKGLTVEIGNTDAEGRLVLADALALADEDAPDLILDFATLTGAARVALGPELPALFTDDDALAEAILAAGRAEDDPVWRMPLWAPYAKLLDSKVADTNHISEGSFAGSITAALFLKKFVAEGRAWAHFDLYAWNQTQSPGRPVGGEAMALRALYRVIAARYA